MYNCIYDCRYCFLQGMYSSANYVIFVNFDDFNAELEKVIEENKGTKITFFSGYDCDSLALESVTGFANHILKLFRKYPDVDLEFRTKSLQQSPFITSKPMENIILAYSLMPEIMSSALDNKTPTIAKRIDVMKKLASKGWSIGLRFDPLIHGKNWKILYQDLLEAVLNSLPLNSIHSVSFGALRFPKKCLKALQNYIRKKNCFRGHYLIMMVLSHMTMRLKKK